MKRVVADTARFKGPPKSDKQQVCAYLQPFSR